MAHDHARPSVEQLEAAAAHLRPRERAVLELSARDRMTNPAIAARLGISVGAVERLLARALCKLDRALKKL